MKRDFDIDLSRMAWPALPAEPDHVQQWRREARELLAAQGLPGAKDEHWRRANFGFLAALAAPATEGAAGGDDAVQGPGAAPGDAAELACVPMMGGRPEPEACARAADVAMAVTSLNDYLRCAPAERPPLPNAELAGDQRLALLNRALGADGARVVVRRDRRAARPIVLAHGGESGQDGVTAVTHAITLEPGASAVLVELYDERCTGQRTLLSEVRIELGAGARLQHVRLVGPAHASHLVDTLAVTLGADARYEQQALYAPARALRSTQAIRLQGDGAQATLHGGAVSAQGADVDLRIAATHEGDRTRSEQSLHVLGGRGRATVDSEAAVPPGRRAVRSQQSLRAVQVDDTCDIALRPRLAILSDDVECRHGATTSAVSDEQLFFLRSRGFERPQALRLLAAAHLQRQFAALDVPALDALVQAQVQAALAAAIPVAASAEEAPQAAPIEAQA